MNVKSFQNWKQHSEPTSVVRIQSLIEKIIKACKWFAELQAKTQTTFFRQMAVDYKHIVIHVDFF